MFLYCVKYPSPVPLTRSFLPLLKNKSNQYPLHPQPSSKLPIFLSNIVSIPSRTWIFHCKQTQPQELTPNLNKQSHHLVLELPPQVCLNQLPDAKKFWLAFFPPLTAEAVLEQNFHTGAQPVPFHKPPSFEEFFLPADGASESAQLNPSEPILNTEIQQITAEEFNWTLEEAEKAARGLRQLKLPRHLKVQAESFEKLLLTTKRSKPPSSLIVQWCSLHIWHPWST